MRAVRFAGQDKEISAPRAAGDQLLGGKDTSMIWILGKILIAGLIFAVAAQQLYLYYDIVFDGSYIQSARIGNIIVVVILWPIAVVGLTILGVFTSFKYISGKYLR